MSETREDFGFDERLIAFERAVVEYVESDPLNCEESFQQYMAARHALNDALRAKEPRT